MLMWTVPTSLMATATTESSSFCWRRGSRPLCPPESPFLELAVEFRSLQFAAAQGPLQLDGSLACRGGLGILVEVGHLRLLEGDEVVDQIFDVFRTGGGFHGDPTGKSIR